MRALELKIPPPVVALLIGTAMWEASRSGPAIELPFLARTLAAVAIAMIGGVTSITGNLAFRRAKTTVNPLRPQNASSLVTSGIYRITRNPMYLGLLLVVAGWAVFLCSAWPFAGPVVFVLYITRFQIVPEERILSAKFGADYSDYMSRVRRWVTVAAVWNTIAKPWSSPCCRPVQLQSMLTCPHCGHSKQETMPTDACLYFYECQGCHATLCPKQGDCCVFCSYGSVKCPPIQVGGTCCAQ